MSKRGNVDLMHQKQEIEILESIYMDEIELHNPIPPYKLSVQCRPYLDFCLNEALERFAVQLEIELTNQYPQESPKCEIKHHVDKISNSHIQQVQKLINRTAEELKGTPMLFEIIESIRGWLQNNIVDPELRPKKLKRKNADDDEEDDENEGGEIVVNLTKKETYTIVTRESFLEWKKNFDLEIETMKRLKGELGAGKEEKLTGKQLFERDMKLISSDLLDKEDDDDVEVDYDAGKEEAKEPEEEEEDSERTRQLFCYNEELFEGGDIDDLDDS